MCTDDVEGWDSISHIILVGAIEKTFQVKFEVSELAAMNTVEAISRLLAKKGVA